MANSYTWNCETVDTYPTKNGETDVIHNVQWELTVSNEEGGQYSLNGGHSVNTEDLSSFISLSSLSHNDIIGWVEEGLGVTEVDALKSKLDSLLDNKINPTTVIKTIA